MFCDPAKHLYVLNLAVIEFMQNLNKIKFGIFVVSAKEFYQRRLSRLKHFNTQG